MWLTGLFQEAPPSGQTPVRRLDAREISRELAGEWSDWLPPEVLLLWLPPTRHFRGGALLLAREEVWRDNEISLLPEWGAMLSQALAVRLPNSLLARFRRRQSSWAESPPVGAESHTLARLRRWLGRRSLWQLGLLALALLTLLPVRLTVLAPAELVPLQPAVIRAPMDGVIDKVLVRPNQAVKKGTALFEFDRINVESRLQIAASTLATSQAEYRSRAQRALFDVESKSQLAVIQGQIEEKRAELDYLKSLSGRAAVTAPMDGVVLFGDATEWVGRPVVTGERVMVVADPQAAEVEAWLSPGDAVPLEMGTTVQVYLNADPLKPLHARLRYVAHEAVARPEGHWLVSKAGLA
jgi:biotin carboxyl carrier protein